MHHLFAKGAFFYSTAFYGVHFCTYSPKIPWWQPRAGSIPKHGIEFSQQLQYHPVFPAMLSIFSLSPIRPILKELLFYILNDLAKVKTYQQHSQ
jgi:hypothetical protein